MASKFFAWRWLVAGSGSLSRANQVCIPAAPHSIPDSIILIEMDYQSSTSAFSRITSFTGTSSYPFELPVETLFIASCTDSPSMIFPNTQ
uniref:Uncharacterized protein n=1 Tax=Candidatus Kentrum sp. LPFa TaxID=2126335 RepID=A0A450XFQ0_9GAMM|nr:MAG: hypothetical protein BECKLPF1236A_GA0070988_100619 [Candidatus Kentron sp. LPFa]VFK28064.1 MAG: hypothetical protein BECKLPF1236C_GA0070990_100579 [Candidatus Kentron sp. LPFa]